MRDWAGRRSAASRLAVAAGAASIDALIFDCDGERVAGRRSWHCRGSVPSLATPCLPPYSCSPLLPAAATIRGDS